MYYSDKIDILKKIFGVDDISLSSTNLRAGDRVYPIVNDVIVLLDTARLPQALAAKLGINNSAAPASAHFSEEIQFTFGEEWKYFSKVLPEHEAEFKMYFDLIRSEELSDAVVCDLGCGIGRWSYFLKEKCKNLILVDFSEAIFVARNNLKNAPHALFFMGDIKNLPFRDDFADFLFCLGVLHHLPTPALGEVKALKKYAPKLLVYLYYALDNRPPHFSIILPLATIIRVIVSKIRNYWFRKVFSWAVALFIYKPFVFLGSAVKPLGLENSIPLYEGYHGKSLERLQQDVYDRFFTGIEQRFTRAQIMEMSDTFSEIKISENLPYWHFLCIR